MASRPDEFPNWFLSIVIVLSPENLQQWCENLEVPDEIVRPFPVFKMYERSLRKKFEHRS